MSYIKITLFFSISSISFLIYSCSSMKKTDNSNASNTLPENNIADKNSGETADLKTIYFDYDRYNIRKDQKENVIFMVKYLKENPGIKLQIQGNTDNRGSTEYNMALGQKRAQALKRFFFANGISNKIETISFGKEKPVLQGENEESWSKNRRDDVIKEK